MSALNTAALRHPRTQWGIEAAMWRAISSGGYYSYAIARSASGSAIVTVIHDRGAVPAFSFFRDGQDVTAKVLPILRAQA